MSHYYVNDDFCKAQSIDGNFDWFAMNYLCEPIDDNKYWIIAVLLLMY